MSAPQQRQARPRTSGPVVFTLGLALNLFFVAVSAWLAGLAVEIAGGFFTPRLGEQHAISLVRQDLEYIAAAPRSLLVGDTVAFSLMVVAAVRAPYEKLGLLRRYQLLEQRLAAPPAAQRGVSTAAAALAAIGVRAAVMTMLIAQDVLLRLSVALFALPAFALAVLLGLLDGMVRRDLRRWSGGRESSFLYHHAKHYTLWALSGGFGLYLAWPFGGLNPAYMVLIFTALVAATLSAAVGAFKKYL